MSAPSDSARAAGPPARLLRRAAALGRDEGGQISFVTVIAAVALAALVGMIVHTGDQAATKLEMQNAADAAALSGAAWVARGLNVVSAFNAIETQLVSGAILLNATKVTLEAALPWVEIQNAAYATCVGLPLCFVGYAVTSFQLYALPTVIRGVRTAAGLLSQCPNGMFWWVSRLLQGMNEVVRLSFYGIGALEALAVAEENGADGGALVPGSLFHLSPGLGEMFFLPVRKAPSSALCDPMEHGSPAERSRGYHLLLDYDVGKGPYLAGHGRLKTALFFLTGAPPLSEFLFTPIAEAQRAMICAGQGWEPPDVQAGYENLDLDECAANGGEATWSEITLVSVVMDDPLRDPHGWFRAKLPPMPELDPDRIGREEAERLAREYEEAILAVEDDPEIVDVEIEGDIRRDCDWRPPDIAVETSQGVWEELTIVNLDGSGEDDPVDYRYRLLIYRLDKAVYEAEFTDFDQEDPFGGTCDPPQPHLLLPDAADEGRLSYFLIAHRRSRGSAWFDGGFFRMPATQATYAQVEVYNGISEDAFTQDWRVRLAPARLLGEPFHALGDRPEVGRVDAFRDLLGPYDPEMLEWINNH